MKTWLERMLLIVSLLLIGRVLLLNVAIILAPGVQEWREGAMLQTTALLMQGKSPYAEATLPQTHNLYGCLYNLTCMPAALAFGNTFAVHRGMSLLWHAVSATLLFDMMRRRGTPAAVSLAGVALLATMLANTFGVLARPGSLGLALLLATVWMPLRIGHPGKALLLSAIAGVLAFYAKPYFGIGIGIVGLHLLAMRGLAPSVTYGAMAFGVFGISAWLIWITQPGFWFSVWHVSKACSWLSWERMCLQLADFTRFIWPVLALLAAGLAWRIMKQTRKRRGRALAALLLRPETIGAVATTLTVTLWLGRHTGAHLMAYFVHLMAPFIIATAGMLTPRVAGAGGAAVTKAVCAGWLLAAGILHLQVPPPPVLDAARNSEDRLAAIVSNYDNILAPPFMAHLLLANGKPLYDNGLTEYGIFGTFRTLPPRLKPMNEAFFQLRAKVERMIEEKAFDAIVLHKTDIAYWYDTRQVIEKYYKVPFELPVYMYFVRPVTGSTQGIVPCELWLPQPERAPRAGMPEHGLTEG